MTGRFRQRLGWVRTQTGHMRRVVHDVGWKSAIGERIGAVAAKSPQWHDLQQQLADATADVASARSEVAALRHQVEQSKLATANELTPPESAVRNVIDDWLWSTNAPLAAHPMITVIMPTAYPERLGYLRSAIDSVLTQTYQHWELIVVNDGATPFLDTTPPWWPVDPRVRLVRCPSISDNSATARNLALDEARGEIIAYLDDDCRWFPWWLHAVAAAMTDEPDLGLVYGVRIVEGDNGSSAWAHAQALDPLELQVTNPVDTNVLAHRAHLDGASWPDLSSCIDYDLVRRLSVHASRFLAIPAATYSTSAPSRTWDPSRAQDNDAMLRTMRTRARRARPLRIVAHNSVYPLLSETYIGDELEALSQRDIDIVLSRSIPACFETPSRLDVPLFESLDDAIVKHDPDLVLMHWGDVGLSYRNQCAEFRVPFGVRMHSFDASISPLDLINEWCAGVWTFPHFATSHPRNFVLDTLILDPPPMSLDDRSRRVLSLSAGLPKKDFAVLLAASVGLQDVPLDIVIATTNGWQDIPAVIRQLADDCGSAATVTANMPYHDAQAAIRRAGAMVYSIHPEALIGQPRSIIEAAIAGTPLVLPRTPELDDLIGPTAHFFERGDATSLALAIEGALDHPHSIDERWALSERVRQRHSGTAALDAWADSVTAAVVRWRRSTRRDPQGAALRWWWPT